MLCGCLEFSNGKKYFERQRLSLKGTSSFSPECKELRSCHSVFKQEKMLNNWKSTTSLGSNNAKKESGVKCVVLKLKNTYQLRILY